MKKNEIQAITTRDGFAKNDYRPTLGEMIGERDRTKGMFFWSPEGNASGRRAAEKRLSICLDADIADGVTVYYSRDVEMSCHHVYASDDLWIETDGERTTITVADLKKLIAAYPDADASVEKAS